MSKNSKAINITLPADLLKAIDNAAKKDFASRSDFIRQATVLSLRKQVVVPEKFIRELIAAANRNDQS